MVPDDTITNDCVHSKNLLLNPTENEKTSEFFSNCRDWKLETEDQGKETKKKGKEGSKGGRGRASYELGQSVSRLKNIEIVT